MDKYILYLISIVIYLSYNCMIRCSASVDHYIDVLQDIMMWHTAVEQYCKKIIIYLSEVTIPLSWS